MAVKTQDDYAKDLAGLKSSYMSATTDQAKNTIKQQGIDLRNQASGQGIDLNALEDSANKVGGYQTGPDEQQFRYETFNAVKPPTQTMKPPVSQPNTSSQSNSDSINTNGLRYQNDYIEKANQLMTQLQQMANNQKQFDPNSNATYQAAQKLAGEAAKSAQASTLQTMSDRGIINSTVTSSQLGQVAQKAELEPLKLIPQLEQNFNQQQQQQFNNLSGVAGTMLNTGLDQQKFNAQLPMQEAALTGRYLPGDAQALIQNILSLKQQAEQPGVTSDQMANFKSQADSLRTQLSSLGVDSNLFGFEQNASQAAANVGKAGQLTTDAQKTLASTLLGLGDSYGSLQQGTGSQIGKLPLFSGLENMFTGLEGQQTVKSQAQQYDQAYKDKTLNLQNEKFTFDKNDANEQRNIQWANVNLAQARITQDQSKLDNDQQSKQATNGYLTQLLSKGTRESAMSYLVDHAQDIIGDNANVQQILDSIDAKWPKPTNSSNSSNTPKDNSFDINKTALEMAQKDVVRWQKARTPEQQEALIQEYKARLMSK